MESELFSVRLSRWREKNTLTQAAAGELLGVSKRYISALESGEKTVDHSSSISKWFSYLEMNYVPGSEHSHSNSMRVAETPHDQDRGARSALKMARENRGLSVAELAQKVGYSIATYQDIEDGRSQMGEKMARKVATTLGIDVSILMAGSDDMPSRTVPIGTMGAVPDLALGPGMERSTVRYVPLLSWAACGQMKAFDDGAYTYEGFVAFDVGDRKAFAVKLSGDSMAPVYGPPDVAVVFPSETPQNGDLVIARLNDDNGGDVMFKIYQASGQRVTLSSYNTVYSPIEFTRDQFAWIYPVDQVTKKTRRSA